MSKKLILLSSLVLGTSSLNWFIFAIDLSSLSNIWDNIVSSMNSEDVETDQSSSEDSASEDSSGSVINGSEVKKETFKVTNDDLEVNWNLYVYGDLIISNWSLTITKGKVKVTGNLKISNWDLLNYWRLYVSWKITVSNWKRDWRPVKLSKWVAKFDSILNAELLDEEQTKVFDSINEYYKELDWLRAQMKAAYKAGQSIDELVKKVEELRDAFYTELSSSVQEEDKDILKTIQEKESQEVTKFIDSNNKFKSLISQATRLMLVWKITAIKLEKRKAFIERIIWRIDTMITNWKLNDNKKALLTAIKSIFEWELTKISAQSEIDDLLDESSSSSSVASSSSSTDASSSSSSVASSSSSTDASSSSSSVASSSSSTDASSSSSSTVSSTSSSSTSSTTSN